VHDDLALAGGVVRVLQPAPAKPTARRDERFGCPRRAIPSAGQVVWVSGRRPHSRLPQSVWANNGVDERMLARRPIGARAWAGERTFGPPALPMLLEPVNGQQPWGIDRENLALAGGGLELGLDVLALAGGVVRVLQPTLAGFYLWLVDVTASTPFLAGHCVGNREWGLRPQTPPPTEMSMVAHNGTAAEVLGRLRTAWLLPPYQTHCQAGGLGVRAQAPFALATEEDRLPRC
jgi:hypothetical protein